MSYLGDNLGAQIIALLQSNFVEGCCAASAISLVLFDHASTISAEIQFIWGRKLTAVTLLFYANRWITFAWAIMSAATQLIEPTSILTCTAIPFTQEALALLLLFLWAAFSSVRVYALSNGSWLLVFLVFLLAVVPFGMNIYGDYWDNTFQFVEMPFAAILCAESSTMSLSLDIKLATATRVCLITSDVIVLLTTWAKSFLMWRDARRLGIPAPLATMLLRDGTAYFAMLLALNILQIVGSITNVLVYAETWFIVPLSSIIVSHFLMNLRQAAQTFAEDHPSTQGSLQWYEHEGHQQSQSSLHFASFVDNMGEMVDRNSLVIDADDPWDNTEDTFEQQQAGAGLRMGDNKMGKSVDDGPSYAFC